MEAEPQIPKLFVYGTLRRGFEWHFHLRQTARFLGDGTIQGRMYDLGEFPGAVPSDVAGEVVRGELYQLLDPESQLKILDEKEECDPIQPEAGLFVRRPTEVRLNTGETFEAWVYFLPREPPDGRVIPSGDFATAHAPQQ